MGGGVFNVSVCKFGSPTILSWPHFFNADQQYLDAVEGLKPDQEKHEFNVEVIPRTGLPLKARARMQINVQLTNVSEIKPADGLRPMVFPIIWFQDGIPEMPEETQEQLRMSANLPEIMKISVLSLSFIFGCALFIGAIIIVATTLCCKAESDDIAEAKRTRPPARPEMLHGHVNPTMDHSGEKDWQLWTVEQQQQQPRPCRVHPQHYQQQMLLYQQQHHQSHHMQPRHAGNGYYDDYSGYYTTPRDSSGSPSKRRKESSNKSVNRSPSDANSAYRAANPHVHYIEAGYPRVPRWANWRSPYPQREGEMMPY